jgi:hypothetical protein
MLKVGGQWVSPVEVENTVLLHPEVQECGVVGYEVADGLVKPIAFVVLRAHIEGTPARATELEQFVRQQLADYKRPSSRSSPSCRKPRRARFNVSSCVSWPGHNRKLVVLFWIASRKKKWFLAGTGALLVSLALVLAYHGVDNSLTPEDVEYIGRYLEVGRVRPLPPARTFDEELTFIRAVQHAVLDVAPEDRGIPDDNRREPRDVYLARAGLCYDRSRVIEKILRHAGFATRHVFILSNEGFGSGLRAFVTAGAASHAVTEVLTARGWLVVDSNSRWLSLDHEGNPRSIEDVRAGGASLAWTEKPPADIYERPMVAVYGLYSRHGRFFPPYNAIPDVNYSELAHNFW